MKKLASLLVCFTLLFAGFAAVQAATVADDIIATGSKYIGTPYQYGAPTGQTKTFDCSSFIQYIFGQHNITLPRTSKDQFSQGTWVSRSDLQKGDLVFFTTGDTGTVDHIGIYLGDGKMLHASSSKGVSITTFAGNSYWEPRYMGAKRVITSYATQTTANGTLTSQIHVVKSGDTLWTIANKYGTTIAAIKSLNGLSSDMIYVGQNLIVSKVYKVSSGDTLWKVANQYNTTVAAIKAKNGLSSDIIYVGQTLKIA